MEMHTGHHSVVQWAGWSFNMDTIYMTWLVMAIVIVIAYFATRRTELVPKGTQNVLESVLEYLADSMKPALGKYWPSLSAILFTYFLFILISNELGLLPSPHILVSPTNDLNTTVGLALVATCLIWAYGIKAKGAGAYFKHFLAPAWPFIVINLLEEVAKPVTLAFRLFGNILAGELLLEILNGLVPYGPPIIWIAFSLIIGIIQALVFTMLVSSYLSMGIGEEH